MSAQASTHSQNVLPIERARIFFDGQYSRPRIHHPEGVAIGPDGSVWCGNANGQVLRIDGDSQSLEVMAETDGFVLGLAFAGEDQLYFCEQRSAGVFKLTLSTRELVRLTEDRIRIPNYPVHDPDRGVLYVSDSHGWNQEGGGVWRFNLAAGTSDHWWSTPMAFANGMALSPDRDALYVAETQGRRITRIAINHDGSPGESRVYADRLPGLPDGIAFDDVGNLFIACYEPARILRVDPSGQTEIYIEDAEASLICHPTNIAFRGSELFCANLGRWHITQIASDTSGAPLGFDATTRSGGPGHG